MRLIIVILMVLSLDCGHHGRILTCSYTVQVTVFIEKIGYLGLVCYLVIVVDVSGHTDLRRRCILAQSDTGWYRVDLLACNDLNNVVRTFRG